MNDKLRQLSTLSQLREQERDDKRIAFAKVAEEIRALKTYLKSITESIAAANIEIIKARTNTPAGVSDRQRFNAYRLAKEAEIADFGRQKKEVEHALKNANQILEEKRNLLVKAEAALKAVATAVENEQLKIKKERAKKEEDEADDIVQSRWGKS